jgi:hypothetical protein
MVADPEASNECRPMQAPEEGKAIFELAQEGIQRLYRLSMPVVGLASLLDVEPGQAAELEAPTEVGVPAVYIVACKAELRARQPCWPEIVVVQRIVEELMAMGRESR